MTFSLQVQVNGKEVLAWPWYTYRELSYWIWCETWLLLL